MKLSIYFYDIKFYNFYNLYIIYSLIFTIFKQYFLICSFDVQINYLLPKATSPTEKIVDFHIDNSNYYDKYLIIILNLKCIKQNQT